MEPKELWASTKAKEITKQLEYLHDRWLDEREYEDFKEYITLMQKMITDRGWKFLKLTKRPFAVFFEADKYSYMLYTTNSKTAIKYKAIA